MGHEGQSERELLASLTDKQREVLDLLLDHQTSKEIARQLGISHHTVDQRIQFAKGKLGVRTRSELAVAYRRLIDVCERTTYEHSPLAPGAGEVNHGPPAEAAQSPLSHRAEGRSAPGRESGADYQHAWRLFEGRHAALMRLGAIAAIAVMLVLLVLGALATLSQLSQLMAA